MARQDDIDGRFVSTTVKTLVVSRILSRLDFCTSLLFGFPDFLLQKLQRVQNCEAPKRANITPILK